MKEFVFHYVQLPRLFRKFLKESNRKSNKIWIDKGSELYNSSVKSWLQKNDMKDLLET